MCAAYKKFLKQPCGNHSLIIIRIFRNGRALPCRSGIIARLFHDEIIVYRVIQARSGGTIELQIEVEIEAGLALGFSARATASRIISRQFGRNGGVDHFGTQ